MKLFVVCGLVWVFGDGGEGNVFNFYFGEYFGGYGEVFGAVVDKY